MQRTYCLYTFTYTRTNTHRRTDTCANRHTHTELNTTQPRSCPRILASQFEPTNCADVRPVPGRGLPGYNTFSFVFLFNIWLSPPIITDNVPFHSNHPVHNLCRASWHCYRSPSSSSWIRSPVHQKQQKRRPRTYTHTHTRAHTLLCTHTHIWIMRMQGWKRQKELLDDEMLFVFNN